MKFNTLILSVYGNLKSLRLVGDLCAGRPKIIIGFELDVGAPENVLYCASVACLGLRHRKVHIFDNSVKLHACGEI